MESKEIVSGLMQELRRGTLILLVLTCLKEPTYGYSLIKILEENGITIEANTLYPLMRRLESQGLLQSQWDTSEGKPRKYYLRTPLGSEVYAQTQAAWQAFTQNVNKLMEGE